MSLLATAESPEQRRRRWITRRAVRTVEQCGPDVQHRFVVRQRLVFALVAFAGVGAMWVMPHLAPGLSFTATMSLFGAAGLLLAVGTGLRQRQKPVLVICFGAGFLALGAGTGSLVPADAYRVLLNPTLLVGVTLSGYILNTVLFTRPESPVLRFLLVGPWLLVACALAHLFPAGEWVLAASGLVALLLVFLLHLAGPEAVKFYQPREYVAAAADVVPLVLFGLWQSWTGQK